MFEVLLALGIVGVVIIGAVLLYQVAMERLRSGEAHGLTADIRGAAERIYAGSATYNGLTMCLLDGRGGVPASARVRACPVPPATTPPGIFQHPYGEAVNVWPVGGSGATPRHKFFAIGLRALDKPACESLAGNYVGQTRTRQGIIGFMVRQTVGTGMTPPTVAADGTITGGLQAPYTIAQVSGACRHDSNDLYLVFG